MKHTMVTCKKCGKTDYDTKDCVGTSIIMVCPDCNFGKMNKYRKPLAELCRKCCPTRHATK